jgi:hypothetical protein
MIMIFWCTNANTKQTKTTETSRSLSILSAFINTKGLYSQVSTKFQPKDGAAIGPIEAEIWPNHDHDILVHKSQYKTDKKTTETSRSLSILSACINTKGSYSDLSCLSQSNNVM